MHWPYYYNQTSIGKPSKVNDGCDKVDSSFEAAYSDLVVRGGCTIEESFKEQLGHSGVCISGVGDGGLGYAKDYSALVRAYKKERKEDHHDIGKEFGLSINIVSPEQAKRESDKLKYYIDLYAYIVVRSTSFWGLIYGSMLWFDIIEETESTIKLILDGPIDNSFLPVITYLKTIWRGDVFFKKELDQDHISMGIMDNYYNIPGASNNCSCPFCSIANNDSSNLDVKNLKTLNGLHNLMVTLNDWGYWVWLISNQKKEFNRISKVKEFYKYVWFMDNSKNIGWDRAMKSLWYIKMEGDGKNEG